MKRLDLEKSLQLDADTTPLKVSSPWQRRRYLGSVTSSKEWKSIQTICQLIGLRFELLTS